MNMDLLDSALKAYEELVPTCVDTGMSYAERVAAREAEIEVLRLPPRSASSRTRATC